MYEPADSVEPTDSVILVLVYGKSWGGKYQEMVPKGKLGVMAGNAGSRGGKELSLVIPKS